MPNSVESLLARMREGSVTQGWGAVSVFSRARLNRLLEQQYIERFGHLTFLPPFMGDISLDEQQTDTASLSLIELGAPLLSFNSASLTNSRALLTMNIIAGQYRARHQAAGATTLSSVFSITEAMGYTLELDIDLSVVLGEIDRQGKVTLNLSQGVNFRCNLAGSDAAENARLARFFQAQFAALPAHRSVFQLGMLGLKGYNALTPTSFRLLTQAADGSKVPGARNAGDGAVVVFIRLRANSADGNFPPVGNFPYLIPDGDPDRYSASLILSQDMLPYFENDRLEVLNNLLFPGANAFVETERHTPHDLAVFGAISPTRTSITLTPQFQTIKAGEELTLTLHDWQGQPIQAQRWEAISLQSHDPQGHGTVAAGVYTAPDAAVIGHESLRVVVTAFYTDGGVEHRASALLTVVFEAMQIAPRVAVRSGGSLARPVALSASTLNGSAFGWALVGPQYGQLSEVGSGAVFTPDARSAKKGLVVQQVEAQGESSRVASLLLINAQQMLAVQPAYVERLGASETQLLNDDSNLLPGLARRWKVIGGGGTVEDGLFEAPAASVSGSSVVSCEVVHNGVVFSSGYSVIELSELQRPNPWVELSQFTIKVPNGTDGQSAGRLYPNGYQQLMYQIETQTTRVADKYYELSLTELASMTLVMLDADDIPTVDSALEGIPEGDLQTWRVREIPNRFDLAMTPGILPADDLPSPDADPVRRQYFYLHSRARAEAAVEFYARFKQDVTNKEFKTTDQTYANTKIIVTPRAVPVFNDTDYKWTVARAHGLGGSPEVEPPSGDSPADDPFDFHVRGTGDYWTLKFEPNWVQGWVPFETVEFLFDEREAPLRVPTIMAPAISMIRWESEQLAETFFSWTGYMFDDPQTDEIPQKISFDAALPNIVPQGVEGPYLNIDINQRLFVSGTLVISLHRDDRVPYIRTGDPSRDKLSKSLRVLLIDRHGNAHRRLIRFYETSEVLNGGRNRLKHVAF